MGNKVTIQDIADALGISRNTVSKAINNTEGLADSTREKILQKAVEMGYKQFSYVGALGEYLPPAERTDKPVFQGEIALLTSTFLNLSHFASLMLDKFQREIAQLGYTMNTHRITDADLKKRSLPLTVDLSRVRAILCIEVFDWDYSDMLCDLGLPILFVDGPSKRMGRILKADQLYMDNTTELTRFMWNLINSGVKKIGFVGNYDHCQSFCERYSAFYLTMAMAGLPVEEQFVLKDMNPNSIDEHIARMDPLPEAFICANDFVAFDVLQSLNRIGKRVPEDVMLCGFDDSAESRRCNPPLTTIHIHTQIIANSAVHLLMSRIQEPNLDYRMIYTETDLICRESTGNLGG